MEELSGSSSRKRQHGTLCSDGDDDDVPMHCPKKSQSSVFSDVQQEFGSDSAVSEGYDTDYGDGMEDEEELEMKTPEVYGRMSRRVSTVRDWPSGCGPLAAVVARDNEEYAGDDGLDGEIVADDYRLDDFEPDYDDDDEEQEGFQSESSVCETQEELVMITGAEDGAESDGSDDDVDWDSWLGPESDLDDVGEAKEEKSTIGIMMTRHLDDEIEEGSRGYDDDEVSTAHGPTAVRVVTWKKRDAAIMLERVKNLVLQILQRMRNNAAAKELIRRKQMQKMMMRSTRGGCTLGAILISLILINQGGYPIN